MEDNLYQIILTETSDTNKTIKIKKKIKNALSDPRKYKMNEKYPNFRIKRQHRFNGYVVFYNHILNLAQVKLRVRVKSLCTAAYCSNKIS